MMTPNKAAGINGTASFATARRGGLSASELTQAQKTLGSRATPAQIAKITGRCELDVRATMEIATQPEPKEDLKARQMEHLVTLQARQKAQDDAKDRLLRQLWEEGVIVRDIAKRLRCGENKVRRWVRALGLPLRRPGRRCMVDWSPDKDAVIRSLYIVGGMPASQVAKHIPKATRMSVMGRAHRLGYRRKSVEQVAA